MLSTSLVLLQRLLENFKQDIFRCPIVILVTEKLLWDARTLAETHSVADLDDQIRELTTMLNKQLADGSTSSSILKSQLKGIVDEL